MDRLIKSRKNGRFQQIVEPGTMRFLDFATLQLDQGECHSFQTGAREYVLDICSGTVTLKINAVGHSKKIYSKVGRRADVFSGPPESGKRTI
jgi:5-deoxy-D-glucuronate isomerase